MIKRKLTNCLVLIIYYMATFVNVFQTPKSSDALFNYHAGFSTDLVAL